MDFRLGPLAGLIGLCLLAACGEDPAPEPVEKVRLIKPYFVSDLAGGQVVRYSGTISASDTAVLSFSVAGTVAQVAVTKGERVRAGDLLATLDARLFELEVEAAASKMASAQAIYTEKRAEIARQQQLFERGWIAKAALDQAVSASESAKADLNLARSKLGTAQRDLENTRLTAPYDGVVADRNVEPFQEVNPGTTAFLVHAEGALEVDLSVPDGIVSRLSIGAPITVNVSTVADCGCTGRISEIGHASNTANAVQVTGGLLVTRPGLLPGMAAEVSFLLSDDTKPQGFLVPLTALVAGDEPETGYLFKYDREEGVVRKVPIQAGEGLRDNLVAVTGTVAAGDIIAAAGAGFLRDGQRVRLMGDIAPLSQ